MIAKGPAKTIADLSDSEWLAVKMSLQEQAEAHGLQSYRIRINTGYGAMLFAQFHAHLQGDFSLEGKDPDRWFLVPS